MRAFDWGRCLYLCVLLVSTTIALAPAAAHFWWTRDRGAWYRSLARAAALLCERWGPAAIKLAQIASARPDLLPQSVIGELGRIQDRVQAPGIRSIQRVLAQAYGSLDACPFTISNWTPIATGSVAVVLRAQSHAGEPLALKIVREKVRRRIESDLRILSNLAGLVEKLAAGRAFPLTSAIADWSGSIIAQCDMRQEASNASRLAAMPNLEARIAAPLADLVRETVLPMHYLGGRYARITDAPDLLYRSACDRLLRSIYRMIFVHGFVHCDFHPGNVALGEDGIPILYDYGLAAEIGQRDRQVFLGLFLAIATRNTASASFEILRSAPQRPEFLDQSAFDTEVSTILDRWSGRRAGEFLIAGFVKDLFELQHRHGIRSVPGFAMAIGALATYEGLIRARYPDLAFQNEFLSFLLSAQLQERPATRPSACRDV